jgi:hypothetical protein
MRSRRRSTSALAAAVLLAVAWTASVARGAGGGFSIAASGCREAASFFLLDPDAVRPFVPERFEIGLVDGFAELVVVTTTCDDLSVGTTSRPVFFSEVGVYIEDVDTSPGDWHYYGLWNLSTDRRLSRRLGGLGVRAARVAEATYSSLTGTADAVADVPWDGGRYDVRVGTPGPIALFGVRPSVWWYSDGADGYVRVVYSMEATGMARSGTGVLRVAAGSDLNAIVGAETRHADNAMIAEYARFEGHVTRVRL